MPDGNIWLISGVPGSGKSSVAKELCRRFERAVHLPVDDIRGFVRSGLATPLQWTAETTIQFRVARCGAARMAADYAAYGFEVFIDDVIRERDIAHYIACLGAHDVRKVLLLPSLDVAQSRNATRTDKDFPYKVLRPVIRGVYPLLLEENTPEHGWRVIDTSELSVAQTADAVLAADTSAETSAR